MGIERAAAALAALGLGTLLVACAAEPATPDLAAFLQRRADCDHFRGEFADPPDPDRQREIDHGLAQYCTGTDAQLAQLKQRYRADPAVTKQLPALEPRVEP